MWWDCSGFFVLYFETYCYSPNGDCAKLQIVSYSWFSHALSHMLKLYIKMYIFGEKCLISLIDLFFYLSLTAVWGLRRVHLLARNARQRGPVAPASHRPIPDDARDVGRANQSLVFRATGDDKVK